MRIYPAFRLAPRGTRARRAYHEAGHAVVAYLLDVKVERAEINSDRYGLQGHCVMAPLHPKEHTDLQVVLDRITILVAGSCTNHLRTGHNDHGHGQDYEMAIGLLEPLALSTGAKDVIFHGTEHRARQMLRSHTTWPAVGAVAEVLIRRGSISGTEVGRLVRRSGTVEPGGS